jgi:hypothetical protein
MIDVAKEQAAAVGQLEQPVLVGCGSRERASRVDEQPALEQVVRQGRQRDLDERTVAARAIRRSLSHAHEDLAQHVHLEECRAV